MMRRLSCFFFLALLSGLVACSTGPGATGELPDVQLEPSGTGELLPEPLEPDGGIRNRRRMDLDQLADSVEVVSGGIRWTEVASNGNIVDMFEALGPTLGYPDYIERTVEDLTASVVFEKFLGDAGRHVCSTMVGRELSLQAVPVLMLHVDPEDTWETNPQGVETNIRYLLLRFHGTMLEEGDPRLDPWLWLFRSSTHVEPTPSVAWHSLCVALFTHPDFYSY